MDIRCADARAGVQPRRALLLRSLARLIYNHANPLYSLTNPCGNPILHVISTMLITKPPPQFTHM